MHTGHLAALCLIPALLCANFGAARKQVHRPAHCQWPVKVYERLKNVVAGRCTKWHQRLDLYAQNTSILQFSHLHLGIYGPKC